MVATLATGIYFGAAVYVNLVEHPARLSCGVQLAVTEWRPSYKRGTLMQAPLAVVGSLSAFIAWWFDRSLPWLLGGFLLLLIIPFTQVVILPTKQTVGEPRTRRAFRRGGQSLATLGPISCG